MELDPSASDTLVVSWHRDVLATLLHYRYEAGALLYLALTAARVFEPDGPKVSNEGLALFLMPAQIITSDEFFDAVDRLVARGFVGPDDEGILCLNTTAIRLVDRRQLPARFRMEWNAAKAGVPEPGPLPGIVAVDACP